MWIRTKHKNIYFFFQLEINILKTYLFNDLFSLSLSALKMSLFTGRQDLPGREITPNTGANTTKFFPLATKSWKLVTKSWNLVAKLATWMFHHNLTERYSESKRFAKINPRQTSSLSLFPKLGSSNSIDN